MGGAVSSGRDNDELVDNLMSGNYIRSRKVERVFRVLDRADYMCAEARDEAYKDLAWRNGPLHLSAPCIYSKVMEALELKPGLSFLNVGSGTGYLSTLVGLIIGSSGISHGVEAVPVVLEYANKKLTQFLENSNALDEFDFCIPKYFIGNGLCLAPHRYDRVYCGAGVLIKYQTYFKELLKVGGVLVMPLADTLVQVRRVSETQWACVNLLNVSFARLREPTREEHDEPLALDEQSPPPLQVLCRAAVRDRLRAALLAHQPELRAPEPARQHTPPAPRAPPRRICIPLDTNSDEELNELNELHELDAAGGAHEMNALLSLVLTMGQNRAAGSLRFDHDHDPFEDVNTSRSGEEEEAEEDIIVFDVGIRAAMRATRRQRQRQQRPPAPNDQGDSSPERAEPAESAAAPADRPEDAATECNGPATERDGTTTEPDGEHSTEQSNPSAGQSSSAERSPTEAARRRRRPAHTSHSDESPSAESSAAPATSDTTGTPECGRRERAGRPRAAPRRAAWTDLSSSEDDAPQIKDTKRQKLDSGIGEGTASNASTEKSAERAGQSASPARSAYTDDDDDADTDMPWAGSEFCGSSGSDSLDESEGEPRDPSREPRDPSREPRDPSREPRDPSREPCDSPNEPRDPPRKPRGQPREPSRRARPHCSTHDHCLRLEQETVRRRRTRGSRRWAGSEGARRGAGGGGGGGAEPRRARLSLAMKRALHDLPLPPALKSYLNYGRGLDN